MPSHTDTPRHWRDLAAETLAIAAEVTDEESRKIILDIANGYAQLARMVQAREAGKGDRREA